MNFLTLCQLPKYKRYCRCSAKIRLGLLCWELSVFPIKEIWQKSFHIFRDAQKCFSHWIIEVSKSNILISILRWIVLICPLYSNFLLRALKHFYKRDQLLLPFYRYESQRHRGCAILPEMVVKPSFPIDALVSWINQIKQTFKITWCFVWGLHFSRLQEFLYLKT